MTKDLILRICEWNTDDVYDIEDLDINELNEMEAECEEILKEIRDEVNKRKKEREPTEEDIKEARREEDWLQSQRL
ncbi:MAG: hypothetical protein ACOCP8_04365 [archaeon]